MEKRIHYVDMGKVVRIFATIILLVAGKAEIFSQEPGEVVYCGSRHLKMIAVTVDDGWVDDWELLNLLASYKIKCTVFIPGRVIVTRPYFLAQLANMGFEIGNHSYSHHVLDEEGVDEIRWDIKTCEELIKIYTPYANAPKYFRPSAGVVTEDVIEAAKLEGYTIVLWDNDLEGYDENQTVEQQIENFKARFANGNIVLSHFGSRLNTARVLAKLIPELKSEGYKFVTVSELLSEQEKLIDAQNAVALVGLDWMVKQEKYEGAASLIKRVNSRLEETFGKPRVMASKARQSVIP